MKLSHDIATTWSMIRTSIDKGDKAEAARLTIKLFHEQCDYIRELEQKLAVMGQLERRSNKRERKVS